MNQKNSEVRKFGIRDKFAYMLGDVGCNLVLTLANSYLLVFYTKVMGVPGAIVGTIFMLARFVDAFTDVAVGRMVDLHSDKHGDRFRPWMVYGSVPLVISSCMMYNYFLADAALGVKVAWLVVTYILFGSVCYTAVNIPYGAMSNVITADSGERASLSTWRNVGAQVGGVILGVLIPMLIYVKDADGNSVASGPRFFWASVVLGIAAHITILICWKWSVERVRIANKGTEEAKQSSNNMKVILSCFKDKALLFSFGFQIFMYAAIQIFFAFNQYMFLDYFKSTALSGLASVVMFLGMILTAPITVPLAKKYGKKEVSIVGLVISVVAYIVIFVTRVSNPYVYLGLIFFAFFGIGIMGMVSYAMTNDCVDNHYLETGDRVEGTVYAMASFVRKMAGAVCTGIGGWALTWIGYNELAVTQTEAVRQSLFNIIVGLPLACFVLTLLFMFFYPLNKKRVEENEKKLETLRAEEQE